MDYIDHKTYCVRDGGGSIFVSTDTRTVLPFSRVLLVSIKFYDQIQEQHMLGGAT